MVATISLTILGRLRPSRKIEPVLSRRLIAGCSSVANARGVRSPQLLRQAYVYFLVGVAVLHQSPRPTEFVGTLRFTDGREVGRVLARV
jgi:hypothetical protein